MEVYMIKKTEYICDTCDAVYKTEEEALLCENSHALYGTVKTKFYRMKCKYPTRLLVEYIDGSKIWYVIENGRDQKYVFEK